MGQGPLAVRGGPAGGAAGAGGCRGVLPVLRLQRRCAFSESCNMQQQRGDLPKAIPDCSCTTWTSYARKDQSCFKCSAQVTNMLSWQGLTGAASSAARWAG